MTCLSHLRTVRKEYFKTMPEAFEMKQLLIFSYAICSKQMHQALRWQVIVVNWEQSACSSILWFSFKFQVNLQVDWHFDKSRSYNAFSYLGFMLDTYPARIHHGETRSQLGSLTSSGRILQIHPCDAGTSGEYKTQISNRVTHEFEIKRQCTCNVMCSVSAQLSLVCVCFSLPGLTAAQTRTPDRKTGGSLDGWMEFSYPYCIWRTTDLIKVQCMCYVGSPRLVGWYALVRLEGR